MSCQSAQLRAHLSSFVSKACHREIARTFNQHHFAGRDATQEEQRVKFINIVKHVIHHADCKAQIEDNPDSQNRQLVRERLIYQQAISVERRRELDLYKRYVSDPDFKRFFDASVSRMLASTASEAFLAEI